MRNEPDQERHYKRAMAAAPARQRRGAGAAATRSFGLGKLPAMLRRRPGTFIGVTAVVMVLTLLYASAQVPLYRAQAELVSASGEAGHPQTILSRDLARSVASALRLDRNATFLQPVFNPVQRLFSAGSAKAGSGALIEQAIERLVERVSVERPGDTVSLLIGFTARDPEQAARIANEYARQFVRRPGSGARILSDAQPPVSPITPGPLRTAAAGLLLALLAGAAAAALRERAFDGITTGDEIERRTGLHNLGTVPLLTAAAGQAASPVDAIIDAPRSAFAEALRSLRTAARIAGGDWAQVVAVTSATNGAGTSTLATCLARTVALAGESVVLIAPEGGVAFDRTGKGAAPEVATGVSSFDEALTRDAASGAHMLCGRATDAALIAALRPHFAWIVIDAPAADATLLPLADLVLVAIRWRSTPAPATRRLGERAAESGKPVFAVLTQVDMRRQVKYVHGDIANYHGRLSKYYS